MLKVTVDESGPMNFRTFSGVLSQSTFSPDFKAVIMLTLATGEYFVYPLCHNDKRQFTKWLVCYTETVARPCCDDDRHHPKNMCNDATSFHRDLLYVTD